MTDLGLPGQNMAIVTGIAEAVTKLGHGAVLTRPGIILVQTRNVVMDGIMRLRDVILDLVIVSLKLDSITYICF